MTSKQENIWCCKIGGPIENLPPGADLPMRVAVQKAFRELTGCTAQFTFSGWAGDLTEGERAVVENRPPHPVSSNVRLIVAMEKLKAGAEIGAGLAAGLNGEECSALLAHIESLAREPAAENAVQRAEYWKAEHTAANDEIAYLHELLSRVGAKLSAYGSSSMETALLLDEIKLAGLQQPRETRAVHPGKGWHELTGFACDFCGVSYVDGAAHFSGCVLAPGAPVTTRGVQP